MIHAIVTVVDARPTEQEEPEIRTFRMEFEAYEDFEDFVLNPTKRAFEERQGGVLFHELTA